MTLWFYRSQTWHSDRPGAFDHALVGRADLRTDFPQHVAVVLCFKSGGTDHSFALDLNIYKEKKLALYFKSLRSRRSHCGTYLTFFSAKSTSRAWYAVFNDTCVDKDTVFFFFFLSVFNTSHRHLIKRRTARLILTCFVILQINDLKWILQKKTTYSLIACLLLCPSSKHWPLWFQLWLMQTGKGSTRMSWVPRHPAGPQDTDPQPGGPRPLYPPAPRRQFQPGELSGQE